MKRTDFVSLIEEIHREILELTATKGRDYAGDDDALSNFKRSAASLGLPPEQVWGVFAGKHWDAIMSYCRRGQVESEPIESRIKDLILYGYLLLGLKRDAEHSGGTPSGGPDKTIFVQIQGLPPVEVRVPDGTTTRMVADYATRGAGVRYFAGSGWELRGPGGTLILIDDTPRLSTQWLANQCYTLNPPAGVGG